MSDRRKHRGPHPRDRALFAPEALPALRRAVAELSWLLTRGYSESSARELVGNRHALVARQRKALGHCACSDQQLAARRATTLALTAGVLRGRRLRLDGLNVLITVEAALSGGAVLVGRDGRHRDLASVHRSYRKVQETPGAVAAIGDVVDRLAPDAVEWLIDRPVSNSGRLAELVRREGERRGLTERPWDVRLVDDPDRCLAGEDDAAVATNDGPLLDGLACSVDLPAAVVEAAAADAWVVDLRPDERRGDAGEG